MSDSDKTEFVISINRINIVRAKITTIIFVILEAMVLLIHYRTNRENLFNIPYIYYGSMYVLMLVAMIAFFMIFTKLGADVSKHISCIRYTGIFFIGFILMWCAGISLLAQLTSGQVICICCSSHINSYHSNLWTGYIIPYVFNHSFIFSYNNVLQAAFCYCTSLVATSASTSRAMPIQAHGT
jgi:predicted metal-binding membrane protein